MKLDKACILTVTVLCAAQVLAIADSAKFKFKKGINLSRLESWSTTSAGYLGQDSTYTGLKSKGFDHIRLPVYFKNYYDSGTQTLKSNISVVDGVLDKCESNGFYVFLDFHGWASINTTNGTDKADFLKIWELVADRYKDRSEYVIFELLNEPHDTEGGNLNASYLNELQAEVMPLIRATNPDRLVLLAAAEWNGPWKLSDLAIPSNPGPIGVVCHTYAPMNFTHQGATWGGFSTDHVTFTSTDKTSATGTGDLDNAFRWIDDFQEKTGVPVVMNEFGVNKQNSKATDAETLDWTTYVARNCESNGIAWTWWEYNQGFGAYYNYQWRSPVMNGLFPAEPAGNTYASTFNASDYAKKLTISFPGYAGSAPLVDFPVLVKLSTSISGFSYGDFARANGDDLRFTDANGNLIPHEVDTWNSTGVSTVWVKVPSLTASTKIFAHYGCALPVAVDSSEVWANGYVGVWHLGEGGLPLRESSKTSTDFTKQNGSGIGYAENGAIGGAVNFGKSGGRRMITAQDCDALDGFTNCTIEAWTYQTSNTTAAVLSKRYASNKNVSYFLYTNWSKTQINIANSESTIGNTAQITPTLNQWNHQAYTFASGTLKGYKDGVKVGSDATVSFSKIASSDGYLHLGNFNRDGAWNAETRNFPGKIDEVRISNVARSADWIKASHDTVTEVNFASYTFGEEVPVSPDQFDISAFDKRMTVTFGGIQNGVILTNFPVLVKLSENIPGFSYADFKKSNGGDLRFADSTGKLLPHEIDTWNPSGISTAWVKVPVLSKGATVTACWGNSGTVPAVDSTDVWDDDYVGVWHLGESAVPMKESTETTSDFTVANGSGITFAAPGAAGGAVDFSNGTSCSLVAPDHDLLDGFSKFTIEAWTMQDELKSNAGVLSKRIAYNNDCAYYIYESGNAIPICMATNKSTQASWLISNYPTMGEWNHLAYAIDTSSSSKNMKTYKNGTETTTSSKAFPGPMLANACDLVLGNLGKTSADYTFNGKIDEVRISKAVRSAAWIKATHDTVSLVNFAAYAVEGASQQTGSNITNLLLKASTDKANPIDYAEGEDIVFNFRLDGVTSLPVELCSEEPLGVAWTRTGDDGITEKGTSVITFAQGCSMTTRMAIPGMIRVTAYLVGADGRKIAYMAADGSMSNIKFDGGAGVATAKMRLSTVEPADFDRFWREAKAKLATVPFPTDGSELTEVFPNSSNTNSYRYYAAKIPCYGPRPVTGWLVVPRRPSAGGIPVHAGFDGYGCVSKAPSLSGSNPGQKIYFAVNAHGYDMIGHDDQYYKDFNDYINKTNRTFDGTTYTYGLAPQDYDNPTNTYFYYMAMRVMRAFEYLKSRPEWNGRDVIAEGGSQGGLQTMWAGGLVDGITKIKPGITWGCDIGCPFNGKSNTVTLLSRTWGIPCVPGAFYFDSALHAKRVPRNCVAEITRIGLADYTSPPRGVLLSYYNMKCQVSAKLVQGSDHGYSPPPPNQTNILFKAAVEDLPPAFASDAAGFDYTNRVVTVTNLAAGATVTLTVASTDNQGSVSYVATAGDGGVATFNVATEAGKGYAYWVSQDGAELASGEFVAGGWKGDGSWFSASAADGSSVVSNGEWASTPAIRTNAYAVDGTAEFVLAQEAAQSGTGGLARIEFKVAGDGLLDADELSGEGGGFGGIAAAESSGVAAWYAFDGTAWRELSGATPEAGADYVVRAEVDFAASQAFLRYSVSADDGAEFAALADKVTGSPYVRCAASGLSSVGFDGVGRVSFLSGALMGADVAEADGVGYESLADAAAAATNSLVLLTNATWPTNTPVGTIAVNRGGYALQGVTLDGNGKAIVQSGYSAIPGEGKVNISLVQAAALGVVTANKSPAQIAAALQAKGANGLEKWESYVLGLDPSDATAKPKAAIAMNGENVELALVGINVNEGAGATVTYKVYKFADLSNIVEQPVGDDRDIDAPAEIQKGAAEPKMFYRLKIDVKGY